MKLKDYEKLVNEIEFISQDDKDNLIKKFESLLERVDELEDEISDLQGEVDNHSIGGYDDDDLISELDYRGISVTPKLSTMVAQEKLEKYIEHLTKNPCEP